MKNKRGITLIALVITIIVLLILAGVSISMISSQDGILGKVTEAKERDREGRKVEKTKLSQMEELITETTTGQIVEQVTDTKPGELERDETDENIYIINSIEDLVFFAYDVTNGNNYSGKTVKLGKSLDFNSTKSYVDPYRTDYGKYGYDGELKTLLTSERGFKKIGEETGTDSTKNFGGTFDGNNNSISNLYINRINISKDFREGLFCINFGIIKNLKVLNSNLYIENNNNVSSQIGGVSGQNGQTGQIESCIASGTIVYKNNGKSGIGGVTGYSSGKIINCKNITRINVTEDEKMENNDDNSASISIGGICSGMGTNGEITSSCNFGDITVINSKVNNIQFGGVVGVGRGKILNCYNMGELKVGSNIIANIGGVIGNNWSNSVNSCYNFGNINVLEGQNIRKGMLIGKNGVDISKITNVYYKETEGMTAIGNGNMGDNSTMVLTEDKMRNNEEFVTLLNQDGNVWKMDTNNINNGYPILSWQ